MVIPRRAVNWRVMKVKDPIISVSGLSRPPSLLTRLLHQHPDSKEAHLYALSSQNGKALLHRRSLRRIERL